MFLNKPVDESTAGVSVANSIDELGCSSGDFSSGELVELRLPTASVAVLLSVSTLLTVFFNMFEKKSILVTVYKRNTRRKRRSQEIKWIPY